MEKIIKKKTGIVQKVIPKTARVRVDRMLMHSKYKKQFRTSKNFIVDVPNNISVSEGDKVEIKEIRPVSKKKAWQISKVIENKK